MLSKLNTVPLCFSVVSLILASCASDEVAQLRRRASNTRALPDGAAAAEVDQRIRTVWPAASGAAARAVRAFLQPRRDWRHCRVRVRAVLHLGAERVQRARRLTAIGRAPRAAAVDARDRRCSGHHRDARGPAHCPARADSDAARAGHGQLRLL